MWGFNRSRMYEIYAFSRHGVVIVNLALLIVAFVLCFGAIFLSKVGGGAYETAALFLGLASIIAMMFAGREVFSGPPRLRRLRAVIMIVAVVVTVVAAVFFATGRVKQSAWVAALAALQSTFGGFCAETDTCLARVQPGSTKIASSCLAPLSCWTSCVAVAGFSDDFRLGGEVPLP